MKRSSRGFSFRGFVALADLIFAVSAGLLLLNPLHFDDLTEGDGAPAPDPAAISSKIDSAERELPRAEEETRRLQDLAIEYLKNNKP